MHVLHCWQNYTTIDGSCDKATHEQGLYHIPSKSCSTSISRHCHFPIFSIKIHSHAEEQVTLAIWEWGPNSNYQGYIQGGGGLIHPTPPPPIKLLNTIIKYFAKLLRRLLKACPKAILNLYAHSLVTLSPQDLLLDETLVIVWWLIQWGRKQQKSRGAYKLAKWVGGAKATACGN